MIQIGNNKIKEVYVGSDIIKGVYYGSEKVWGKEYPQDGYWVHKDTGVKTYFDAGANFITGKIMNTPPWSNDCSEVKIPSGVTGLGESCFEYCSSLTSIDIPEGVTSLEHFCFFACSSLTSITLPESVTSLGINCFRGCTSLILATVLPAIPPSIETGVFFGVHTSFNIWVRPPYVDAYKQATNWAEYADKISATPVPGYWVHKDTGVKTYFGLEDPSIVNGIMSKPSWASKCSEVKLPTKVTSLGYQCFFNCTSLTSIILPEDVTSLEGFCFSNCASLTSINIPEGVTSLGERCFYSCSSLTSINIPESVVSLGRYCFYNCSSLTLATVLPAIPPSIGVGIFDDVHSSLNIKVRSPYVNAYKTATNWSSYADIISAI